MEIISLARSYFEDEPLNCRSAKPHATHFDYHSKQLKFRHSDLSQKGRRDGGCWLYLPLKSEKLKPMGRKRTHLKLTQNELAKAKRAFRNATDERVRERLLFSIHAHRGVYTLEDLARISKRSRATIQNWLGKYASGGLDGLLERDTPPGIDSPLSAPDVQKELMEGIKGGRWTSAASVAAWLQETHGIRRSRKSIYYWFVKLGISPISSRSRTI